MANFSTYRSPKYARALIALLLGTALCWSAAASTAGITSPAEACNLQSSICHILLPLTGLLQRFGAALAPTAVAKAIGQGRTAVAGLLHQIVPTYTRTVDELVAVVSFALGLALVVLGMIWLVQAGSRTAGNFRYRRSQHRGREAALRSWFRPKSPRFLSAAVPLAFGILSILAASLIVRMDPTLLQRLCSSAAWLCTSPRVTSFLASYIPMGMLTLGAVLVLLGIVRLTRAIHIRRQTPSDRRVKGWFEESREQLQKEALRAVGLFESELASRSPLFIMFPIIEPQRDFDVPDEDIMCRVAKDGTVYCGAYLAIILFLTQRHLAAYEAEYSFIRGLTMDEDTFESHYEDIVSLSTAQKAYTKLDTGDKIKWAEEFTLCFRDGRPLTIPNPNDSIFLITGGSKLPATDAEQAIAIIRSKLRDIKRGADQVR